MSKKTKIRKVDFVSAMNALDGIKRIVESETARNMCVVWHSGNLAAMIKPFDMAANGSGFDKAIKQDDFNALVCKWFGLFDWLSSEDSHADLFFAFLQMNDEFIKAGSGCFSPGAFIGVYGVFRVALMRCLTEKCARTFGGKSVREALKEVKESEIENARNVLVAQILAKGEKTRKDYLELQYLEFERSYFDALEDTPKKKNLMSGLLETIRLTPVIFGVKIPLDAGLTKADAKSNSALYHRWYRQLQKNGFYKRRKNKPGAGGKRQSSRISLSA